MSNQKRPGKTQKKLTPTEERRADKLVEILVVKPEFNEIWERHQHEAKLAAIRELSRTLTDDERASIQAA